MKKLLLILTCVTHQLYAQTELTLVKDINPGEPNSAPGLFAHVNDQLFFIANNGTNGIELWKTDGTVANTIMIKDIGSGGNSYCESTFGCGSEFIVMNNIIYFRATDASHGAELWRSDGTEAGTYMVKDINPGPGDCSNSVFMSGQYFAQMNDVIYFAADGGGNNIELWRSDGTELGTYMVKDFAAGASSIPQYITAIDDNIYFQCKNTAGESEVWKSDGTEAGSVLLKQMWMRAFEYTNMFVQFNDHIYFPGAATDPYDLELWRTDGTAAGTELFYELNPEEGDGSDPKQFHIVNDKLLFVASPESERQLFTSDGTVAGTTVLEDENGNPFSPADYGFLQTDSKLYFQGDNATHEGLWITDGNSSGTKFLLQIESGGFDENAAAKITGNNIVFGAYDDDNGCTTLFQSNGSEDGTFQATTCDDISYPTALTEYNGTIIFNGTNDAVGAELFQFSTEFEVAINYIATPATFNVFPNPAIDFINLHFSNQNASGTTIIIKDITGKIAGQYSMSNKLEINYLSPGIYFIQAGNLVTQFVKL